MVINVLKKETIMKKDYIMPQTKKVVLKSRHHLLSGSINGTNVGLGKGGNTSDGGITSGNSRNNSYWDDDEY